MWAYGIESRNIKRVGLRANEKRFNWNTSFSKVLVSAVNTNTPRTRDRSNLQCSLGGDDQLCAPWSRMRIILISNEEDSLYRRFRSTFYFSITCMWMEQHNEPVTQDPITAGKDITHRHPFARQRWKRVS